MKFSNNSDKLMTESKSSSKEGDGLFGPPGDIWPCLDVFLVGITERDATGI